MLRLKASLSLEEQSLNALEIQGWGWLLQLSSKVTSLFVLQTASRVREVVDMLRALGATVHVCLNAVAPDHPESYYSAAEKL